MNKIAALLLLISLVISLIGCATTQDTRTTDEELNAIRQQDVGKQHLLGP